MLCKAGVVRSSLVCHSPTSGVLQWSGGSVHGATASFTLRSLCTEKTDSAKAVAENANHKKQPAVNAASTSSAIVTKSAVKKRRFVTSARILPDGFVRPALYDEDTPIPRCESYPPTTHFMEVFPWLLSAQRQRTPMDDLGGTTDVGTNAPCLASAAMRFLPLSARRSLAQSLNVYVARCALGQDALDDLCAGAAAALPEIARLLTAASAGDAEAARGLESSFTAPLLARYINDLDRLRDDNVHLDLQVRRINSAQIRQLRTETGPAEAYTAADAYRYYRRQEPVLGTATAASASASAAKPMSMLRAGLARQRYEYTNVFGASYAGAQQNQQQLNQQQQSQQQQQQSASDSPSAMARARSWASGMWSAANGKAPVRVRVDVELNADMRYQLIGRHKTPTEYDRHKDTNKVIVDDDATRNLMLTLESTTAAASSSSGSAQHQNFQWRVADIDYLLSSEQRIWHELEEAQQM